MTGKIALLVLAAALLCGVCYADVVKGDIESVNIKSYEIIVAGQKIEVSKAIAFTVNDLGVTKSIIVRDLKDHKGEKAVCYGSTDKNGIFVAYKVRVGEGHK